MEEFFLNLCFLLLVWMDFYSMSGVVSAKCRFGGVLWGLVGGLKAYI
jgi:hypothetical protein